MTPAALESPNTTAPETPKRDFRQEVTDNIIAMLGKGVAPWQKPWRTGPEEACNRSEWIP